MNSARALAYGRVVHTLEEIGATKLQAPEQERIRDAADTLLFTESPDDARAALVDVHELTDHLLEVDRWTPERAERLLDDLTECGPLAGATHQ